MKGDVSSPLRSAGVLVELSYEYGVVEAGPAPRKGNRANNLLGY